MRTFTAEGPCDPRLHHIIPPASRLPDARWLVDQGAYFPVRAPRRTGKTTSLRALAAELTAEGRYAALCFTCEVGEPLGEDLARAEQAVLASMRIAAEHDLPPDLRPPPFPASEDATRIWAALDAWARACPRPLVLFFDEIDTLHGHALRAVLRQLRAGFARRPGAFPWSVALASPLDLRDELLASGGAPVRAGTSIPFDIAAGVETLPRFTMDEVRALYAEHTAEAGQPFVEEAVAQAFAWTAGHPFLVGALGREALRLGNPEPPRPILPEHIDEAAWRLLAREVTPIDALDARLAEPGLRRVLAPLIIGSASIAAAREEDVRRARELGLLAPEDPAHLEGDLVTSLVLRKLAAGTARAIEVDADAFYGAEGRLDPKALLEGFSKLVAAHGEALERAADMDEAGPFLVLLGFLHRALGDRGRVTYRLGAGSGRLQVTLHLPGQRVALVIAARHKGERGVKARGLSWLDAMLDDGAAGALIVFDRRRKSKTLGGRVRLREARTPEAREVLLLRA